ncbi:MAG: hypothetical protein ACHQ51_01535 [Elusimicrobiota bacterium]
MDVALIGLGTKDIDTVLAWIMFTGVALAAGLVLYLLGRHHQRKRKAKKNHAHKHPPQHPHHPPR